MGYCCSDVLKRATVESHGKPICVCGVSIAPGDLIFGDINGMVVIPKEIETEVLERAVATITREKEILEKIIQNVDAKLIYESDGGF
jgi:regulator of RNase E activity RraA